MGPMFPLVLACALVLPAAYVCIRIEVFNQRVGGYLPREKDAEWGISKWREAPVSGIAKADEEARQNNRFRDFVSTWGLSQYLLAPLALFACLVPAFARGVPRGYRLTAGSAAAVALTCIVLMFYRGYYSSLGW